MVRTPSQAEETAGMASSPGRCLVAAGGPVTGLAADRVRLERLLGYGKETGVCSKLVFPQGPGLRGLLGCEAGTGTRAGRSPISEAQDHRSAGTLSSTGSWGCGKVGLCP